MQTRFDFSTNPASAPPPAESTLLFPRATAPYQAHSATSQAAARDIARTLGAKQMAVLRLIAAAPRTDNALIEATSAAPYKMVAEHGASATGGTDSAGAGGRQRHGAQWGEAEVEPLEDFTGYEPGTDWPRWEQVDKPREARATAPTYVPRR